MKEKYIPANPFPYEVTDYDENKTYLVVDEWCYCGRKRSEHGHTIAWGHGQIIDVERQQVTCHKFTWKEWILEPVKEE